MVLQTLINNKACAHTRTRAHAPGAGAFLGPGAGQLLAPTPEPVGRAGERRRSARAQPWAPGQRGRPAWTPRHFLRRLHAPSLAPSGPPHRPVPPAAAGFSQSPTQGPHGAHSPTSQLKGTCRARLPPPGFRARRHCEQAPVPRPHRGCDPLRPAAGSGRLRGPGRTIRRGEQGCTKPSGYAHLSPWEWERDGRHWASPVPVGVKGGGPKGIHFVLITQTVFNSTSI